MKITIAIDSFKGSLSSMEAGTAAMEGVKAALPNAEVYVRPLADGGEGTVEALAAGMGGRIRRVKVTGPLEEPVECSYCIIEKEKTAIIEMSGAAGITLIPADRRNPLYATTYGVGETMKDAIRKGCRKFIIGIGGSATNDGGIGMLQALGYGFYDAEGKEAAYGAKGLENLAVIEDKNVLPELMECEFFVACDVTNPLCGENGCSAIYGPQKGADPKMVQAMDAWMLRYAELVGKMFRGADRSRPGTGAAGGLGFAFQTFFNAVLEPGVSIVLRETRLEQYVKDADLVITGEGRLDGQTAMGKAPAGVAGLAKKYKKSVIAFAGCVAEDAGACNDCGIDAFFPILRKPVSLEEAMDKDNAWKNVAAAAEQAVRLWNAGRETSE